jgi:hypothetical protein
MCWIHRSYPSTRVPRGRPIVYAAHNPARQQAASDLNKQGRAEPAPSRDIVVEADAPEPKEQLDEHYAVLLETLQRHATSSGADLSAT